MAYQSTILIVDDEPIGRDTLEALLFTQGYNLIFAGAGPEALTKAAEFKPDVILLDVMMPGIDGFEVCRRLRADPSLAEVPVIMVTALDDQDSRLLGIEAGADDFISKPFNRMELRVRIQTITRLNRYRRLLLERTKFEWVVDQADVGYLILTAEDEILYANAQAHLYLNLPSNGQEAIAQKFLDTAQKFYHCQPEEAWANWPEATEGASSLYLVQPGSSHAHTFWLQVDLMEMNATARERYLVRLRDVTSLVAERRAMWAFHSQVGHKLRTPLALIDGFLEFLLEDESLSEAEREALRPKIRKNTLQLQTSLLDILHYTRIQDRRGSTQAKCIPPEIPPLITKICDELGLEAIRTICPETDERLSRVYLPLSVQGLELILAEFFKNAQKFHPEQAPTLEVEISRAATPVGSATQSDCLCIRVKDDGVALTAEQLARIWTPYYQAERGFSGQAPGMGLGLAMVASLIWSVGGSCRAINRLDRAGLVVEVELPLFEADEAG